MNIKTTSSHWLLRVIMLIVLALLLSASMALARSGEHDLPPLYTVAPGTASGTAYHLSGLSWRVSGSASGAGYRLDPAIQSVASGCCCTYLPLALRNCQ